MVLVSNEHTASSRFEWFNNNIRQSNEIMVESRMIRKNHCLVEHILHFQIYHFLEVLRTWLSKTSTGDQFIELVFSFSESRLLRDDIQSPIYHRFDVMNFPLIAVKLWKYARITTDCRRIPETIAIWFQDMPVVSEDRFFAGNYRTSFFQNTQIIG